MSSAENPPAAVSDSHGNDISSDDSPSVSPSVSSESESEDEAPERKKVKTSHGGDSHPERAPTVLGTLERIVACVVCYEIQPNQRMFKHCQDSLICEGCYNKLDDRKKCAGCRQEGVYRHDYTAEAVIRKHCTYPCPHHDCGRVYTTAEECKDHALNHDDHKVESGCTIKMVSNPNAECDDQPMHSNRPHTALLHDTEMPPTALLW